MLYFRSFIDDREQTKNGKLLDECDDVSLHEELISDFLVEVAVFNECMTPHVINSNTQSTSFLAECHGRKTSGMLQAKIEAQI